MVESFIDNGKLSKIVKIRSTDQGMKNSACKKN